MPRRLTAVPAATAAPPVAALESEDGGADAATGAVPGERGRNEPQPRNRLKISGWAR